MGLEDAIVHLLEPGGEDAVDDDVERVERAVRGGDQESDDVARLGGEVAREADAQQRPVVAFGGRGRRQIAAATDADPHSHQRLALGLDRDAEERAPTARRW